MLIQFLTVFSSGVGSHYGTFSGPVDAFSPKAVDKKAYESSGRNFLTNPLKKGTGYGYVSVLIGKPETYSSEPYDRGREIFVVSILDIAIIYFAESSLLHISSRKFSAITN